MSFCQYQHAGPAYRVAFGQQFNRVLGHLQDARQVFIMVGLVRTERTDIAGDLFPFCLCEAWCDARSTWRWSYR